MTKRERERKRERKRERGRERERDGAIYLNLVYKIIHEKRATIHVV